MIFNVSGGGGTALNFRVVGGTTAPANPAENCIWVNTDTPITSWLFSATEPSPAESGMVWIASGTSSPSAFNALKKNGIQVYPISAKQYVGGAWVDVEAAIYQGGEWVEWWDGELFDNGNQYEYITGGWWQNKDLGWTDTYCKNTGTVIISDSLMLESSANVGSAVSTKKPIDLTGYSSINIDIASNTGEFGLIVHDNLTGGLHTSQLADVNLTGTGVKSLDVSAIDGSHYITMMAYNGRTAGISKVWLER